MKYYFYRLQKNDFEKINDLKSIQIDFIPPDCANFQNGDKCVIYVSETFEVLGVYEKKEMVLKQTRANSKPDMTLKDYWEKLSFVKEITQTTSRLFKKKMREVTQTDFESLTNNW